MLDLDAIAPALVVRLAGVEYALRHPSARHVRDLARIHAMEDGIDAASDEDRAGYDAAVDALLAALMPSLTPDDRATLTGAQQMAVLARAFTAGEEAGAAVRAMFAALSDTPLAGDTRP